jgi:hypothetical protein
MSFRWWIALTGVASLLLVASCGGGGSNSANPPTTDPSTPTVSLPLQPGGLAIGGDVQSQATDVLRRGITEEQAREIADACRPAAEIANVPQDCLETIIRALERSGRCGTVGFCLEAFDVSSVQGLVYDGYVEIVEDRPDTSLCGSGPRNLCLRVGVGSSMQLQRIATSTVTTASSPPTTSTTTATETTPTSSSDTSSTTTPDVTSAPTASS